VNRRAYGVRKPLAETLGGRISNALLPGLIGILIGALSPVGDLLSGWVHYGVDRLQIALNGYPYSHDGLTKAIEDNNADVALWFVGPHGYKINATYTPDPNKFRPLWYAAEKANLKS
jgi:hypothetical protein